ncbi:hypothetical protein [Nocardia bovistercoris]|uniref:Uncharacterized protein n=1 Tax=Nocardia bovistercoris TaxID=2785916 RepID=A0A931IDD6_9NOCA|nr:hypothetical protein [Nocardia bovistercoris]MBH0779354.1 hypothetical protein [Nocardia bovistercoris]
MKRGNGSAAPSRAVTAWTQGLLCVAIVACGVIVGGLLHEPEPELTTAPIPATTTVEPAPPTYSFVTPPVTYPTTIPGCASVEPPSEDSAFGFVAAGSPVYDNPRYPWFSGRKAVAMSEALRGALPDGVAVDFAPARESLLFQPIVDAPADHPEFSGFTGAYATVRRGDRTGRLQVNVQRSDRPVPPCVAGALDERRLLDDGVTVDTQDTWSETNGVRTLTRSAQAYVPDGTVVTVFSDNNPDGSRPASAVPLSVDELRALATTPGMRVTAPVPAGTPDAPESCDIRGIRDEESPAIDQGEAERLNKVLAAIPLDDLSLNRPLGALLPGEFDNGGLCQVVRVTRAAGPSQLEVVITVGAEEPSGSSDKQVVDTRRLPDGTVVENRESPGWSPATRGVVVTYRSGTRVAVDSSAEDRSALLTFAQLEAIGLAPGLEVSR